MSIEEIPFDALKTLLDDKEEHNKEETTKNMRDMVLKNDLSKSAKLWCKETVRGK